MQKDAASPLAPEAAYGRALCELELRRPEAALKAFRDFTTAWPEHAQAPSATFYTAHTLVDLKRQAEAVPILVSFQTKYPKHKLAPDAQYLLGVARLALGEREAGREDLKAFLAAYPSHSMASAARQAIAEAPARSATATSPKSPARTPAPSREAKQPRETTQRGETTQPREPTEAREPAQSSASADALYDAGAEAGRAGRAKDQEAAWRRLRKEFPNHPLAHRAAYEQAEASFKKKAYADAAAQAKAAAASPELRGRALLLEGESELKLNRYRDAAKSFEGVGAVKNLEAGDRYRALAGLGLAREELGELRQALDAYESVASKSPDSTLRNWARDRAAAVKGRLGKPAAGNEKRS
jgi:TolA-binding protein